MPKQSAPNNIQSQVSEKKFSWVDFGKGIFILILGCILFIQLDPFMARNIFGLNKQSTLFNFKNQSTLETKKEVVNSHIPQHNSPVPTIESFVEATSSAKLPTPTNSGKTIRVPIFYFHYIGYNANPKTDPLRTLLSITPDSFDKILAFITQKGYNPITLDTLYNALIGKENLPPKALVLTFDDGYIDLYVNAYPLLRKYNIKATAFIATGLVEQPPYLHWEQIKEMDKSGLISFEAHSVTHPDLTTLSSDKVKLEITQSKQMLESYLSHPVHFFAYPYGLSNKSVQQEVTDARFLGAVGTWYGETESEGTLFNMPRISDPGSMSVQEFENRLTDMHLK